MLIIPAIDLKDGRCVRLQQGQMDKATVFSEDPVAMARHWAAQGARRLHIVDLNGAVAGRPKNEKIIREIMLEPDKKAMISHAVREALTEPLVMNIVNKTIEHLWNS